LRILRNSELKGILAILLVILALGFALAASTGKLEQWFHVTWFSGPRIFDRIVYTSGEPGARVLYSIKPDGTQRLRLGEGFSVISGPVVSPVGNRIAFVGTYNGATQVYSVDGVGGSIEQLTSATGPKLRPGFSPDGKRLSFVASGKVYVADLNGDNPDPVLPTQKELHGAIVKRDELPAYTDYAWGSNSASMVGVTGAKDGSKTIVYLPDFERDAQAVPVPGKARVEVRGLTSSTQKQVFAFTLRVGATSHLVLFDVDAQSLAPAGNAKKQDFGPPTLSPDGSKLIFAAKSSDSGVPSGLVRVDTASRRAALMATGIFEDLVYSPDGSTIAATRVDARTDTRNIVVIDDESGEITQLTDDGRSCYPTWAPNRSE